MPPTKSHSRSTSTKPQYPHLTPRVTHVSESRIRKKWKPLPPTTQDRVRQLVLTVNAESRATRRGNSSQATKKPDLSDHEWDTVVDTMVERLLSRLPRLPFPPASTTTTTPHHSTLVDFDHESTLTRSATLSSTVTSDIQSCKLLRTQIAREQRLLKRDRKELEGLHENVKSGRARGRREQGRLHVLARGLGTDEKGDLAGRRERVVDVDAIEGRNAERKKAGTTILTAKEVQGDERLAPLMKQLRSHLGSLHGNVAGLKPVRAALEEAEGVVMRFASMT